MLLNLATLIWLMFYHHVTYSDTFDWKPDWMPDRTDLKCQAYCETEHGSNVEQDYDRRAVDKCCTCRSSTTWENSLEDLYIEFTTVLGGSVAVSTDIILNTTYYSISQTDSVMTSFPSNLCEVPYLMKLNFTHNRITSLQGIGCAYNLDTLDLSNNELNIVKNTTFAFLKVLRIIDLSNNKIAYIEPNVFSSFNMRFLSLYLSYNDLTKLDITNIIGLYPFCDIDYQHNEISEVVNENSFTIDLNKTYGPGMVDLKDNLIQTFPDFKTLLLLDDLTDIGKLFEFGFDLRGSPIICDCNMETFLELAVDIIESIWLSYFDVICTGPEKHVGKRVIDVPLNELICHLGVEDGCPVECNCIDDPSNNTITIECVNALLDALPDTLPESNFSDKIDLNFANNSITEIPNHLEYLNRIDTLNISNNDLTEITEYVASLLENATGITLAGNDRLNHLPQQFQFKSPCELQLNGIIINCDCNMTWLQNWLSTKTCDNQNLFYCFVDGKGLIDVREFRKDMLECFSDFEKLIKTWAISLSIALFVIVLTAVTVFMFRYELLVIYVRFITQYSLGKHDEAGMAGIKHHAFFSFDECNQPLRKWVIDLRRYLTQQDYDVIVPVMDIIHGSRDEEAIKEINKSACVIVILSDSYANEQGPEDNTDSLERQWLKNEWKYAWNKFCSRPSKRLILVNYDHSVPGNVSNRRMKAYLRVGKVIDFTNTERDIMSIIEKELGDCSSVKTKYQQPKPGINLTELQHFNDRRKVPEHETVEMITQPLQVTPVCENRTDNPGLNSNNDAADSVKAPKLNIHEESLSKEQPRESNGKLKIKHCSKVAPMPSLLRFNPNTLLDKEGGVKYNDMNIQRTDTLTIFQVEENDKADSDDDRDIDTIYWTLDKL